MACTYLALLFLKTELAPQLDGCNPASCVGTASLTCGAFIVQQALTKFALRAVLGKKKDKKK